MELYVHIPFCVKKCAYCDFLSFPQGEEIQRRYVEKLMEEIRKMCIRDRKQARLLRRKIFDRPAGRTEKRRDRSWNSGKKAYTPTWQDVYKRQE